MLRSIANFLRKSKENPQEKGRKNGQNRKGGNAPFQGICPMGEAEGRSGAEGDCKPGPPGVE